MSLHHHHSPSHSHEGAVLEVSHLSVAYGGRPVLNDVSFGARAGESIAVVGPNGAGKSTMFKAICGLVNHEGDVDVNGVHCHHRTDRMDIAYIAQQQHVDVTFPITVGELVASGRRRFRRWFRRNAPGDVEAIDAALQRVRLEAERNVGLNELSGGQLQRAYLARALAQQASILLLDEALNGIDQPRVDELLGLFDEICATGTTVLVSTHDLGLARHRFSRCLAINGGVIADGAPDDVLTPDVLDITFGRGTLATVP
jgi:manganese/iron transport system ATP-binding protein